MGNSAQVISVILPVILVLAAGMLFRRTGILSEGGVGQLKQLLINFCIPGVVFKTFYSTRFSWKSLILVLIMFVITLAAWYIGKKVQRRTGIRQEMFPYLCTTLEGGQMGFALFILLFGQDNLYHLALLDLGNALILFPVIVTRLRIRAEGEAADASAGTIARSLITPINVAMFSGIIISVTGLGNIISGSGFGTVLDACLSFIGGPTSALILLIVGFGLSFGRVKWPETLKTIGVRAVIMAVFGVAVFFIARALFPDDILFRYAVVMAFVLPPSYMYSVFTKGEKEDAYVGSVLALFTVITIVGYIILAVASSGIRA